MARQRVARRRVVRESQQPTCPHSAQRRKCPHQPPLASHSTQPMPLGAAVTSIWWLFMGSGNVATDPSRPGRWRPAPCRSGPRPAEGDDALGFLDGAVERELGAGAQQVGRASMFGDGRVLAPDCRPDRWDGGVAETEQCDA